MSYLPYEPRQRQLLPAALQEWLAEGRLPYYISDVIDGLDLSAFHARYAASPVPAATSCSPCAWSATNSIRHDFRWSTAWRQEFTRRV